MLPVVTPGEMAEADRRTIAAGTPEAVLVERAGRAVAWAARALLGGTYGRRVAVLAGRGNNGNDGRVAARVLHGWGAASEVLEPGAPLDRAHASRVLDRADLVVDAMFGTGFRGVLDGDAAWAAARVGEGGVPVLAVDVPSGVDGATGRAPGPAVAADATVCFAALKPGLLFEPGRTLAGTVSVVDLGIDVTPSRLWATEVRDLVLPCRTGAEHKWDAGVLVVGGSAGMVGAPLLAARAAGRAGAGMVVCALPGREATVRAGGSEIVCRELPATPEGRLDADAGPLVLRDLERFGALVVGPGLGSDAPTAAAVQRLVAEAPLPVVVDADGLGALALDPAPLRVRRAAGLPPAVLTPHAGEYARLAGEAVGDDRVAAARRLAAATGAIVLLKGPGTVVAHPDSGAAVCPLGDARLATAGTGDVLSGITAALLALGVAPFAAAASAAYVHAAAADVAGTGSSLLAGDLVRALPRTLDELRRSGARESPPAADAAPEPDGGR